MNTMSEIDSRPANRLVLTLGAFFFRFRNAIFPSVFVLVFMGFTPTLQLTNPALDRVLTISGVVLALLGASVRLLVIGFAYIQRGGKNRKVYADSLVMTGLYAHSRNPMYVGNILITVGVGMMYGSPVMLGVIPAFVAVYALITAAEEDYLSRKFGAEFDRYCENVPRFIPNLKGIRRSLQDFTYDWRKVLRKDYGTFSATLSGIIAILMWKIYWAHGFENSREQLLNLGVMLLPILCFYLVVYRIKHQGGLQSPPVGSA